MGEVWTFAKDSILRLTSTKETGKKADFEVCVVKLISHVENGSPSKKMNVSLHCIRKSGKHSTT